MPKAKQVQQSQPIVKPRTDRVIREHEIIKSDRMELINMATRVVSQLSLKQMIPLMHSSYPGEATPMDACERKTYEAALAFLTRQFEQGYSLPEHFEKKVEVHYGTEQPPS